MDKSLTGRGIRPASAIRRTDFSDTPQRFAKSGTSSMARPFPSVIALAVDVFVDIETS
ncbi:hypothetical protein [Stieleria marina]|uniref:hypothetical protein n=1 Tax=Stieleria marina TaxID=1930275 RepID=UPI003AF3680E